MHMTSNAYMSTLNVQQTAVGALANKTFSVKDVFALAGHTNSAGNPTWLQTHKPSVTTAPVITKLLEEGAVLNGMTHTDELMYSLNGENVHYGMPKNPYDDERICGGSSSGAAASVANGEAVFAIGTDTGGSVRIPAAYCGLYGIRPTYEAVSLEGVIPLAKSFDTVGWMAQDAQTLAAVGDVLLPVQEMHSFTTLLVEQQSFQMLSSKHRRRMIDVLTALKLPSASITLAAEGLDAQAQLFRHIQGIEIWQQHGKWITEAQPTFAQPIAERFQWASTLQPTQYDERKAQQQQFTDMLHNVIGHDRVLVIPTIPDVAPKKEATTAIVEAVRTKTMALTCIAGLSGCPQITVPLIVDGLPIGLSFIAAQHSDRALLQFVQGVNVDEALHNYTR